MSKSQLVRIVGLAALLAVVAVGGLGHSAFYLEWVGLPAPNRDLPLVLAGIIIAIAIACGIRPSVWSAAPLAPLSLALLLTSTPFTSGNQHLLTTVACALLTLAFAAAYLPEVRAHLSGPALSVVTVVCIFFVGEAIATRLPSTHAVGYTLGSKLWYEKYRADWFRTNLSNPPSPAGQPIFLVGDSFAAGNGIPYPRDRLSDRLQRKLTPRYHIRNLAQGGLDSREEYERLIAQPDTPAGLILVYYTNDIEHACRDAGLPELNYVPYSDIPAPIRYLLQRSYFLDALYWRIPHTDGAVEERYLDRCFADSTAIALHLRDLDRFTAYADSLDVPFVVVAFPSLVEPATTRRRIDPVLHRYRSQGIPVLDVAPLAQRLEVRDRIVNANDAHPSILLNDLVADSLWPIVRQW